jgi:hypothetical protein
MIDERCRKKWQEGHFGGAVKGSILKYEHKVTTRFLLFHGKNTSKMGCKNV